MKIFSMIIGVFMIFAVADFKQTTKTAFLITWVLSGFILIVFPLYLEFMK